MEDVELTLHRDPGQISAEALYGALGEVLDLLREAADLSEIERQYWRIESLHAASAHVAMMAPQGDAVAAVVQAGIDELRQVAAVPNGWSRKMVKNVRDLGRWSGKGGTHLSASHSGDPTRPPELSTVLSWTTRSGHWEAQVRLLGRCGAALTAGMSTASVRSA